MFNDELNTLFYQAMHIFLTLRSNTVAHIQNLSYHAKYYSCVEYSTACTAFAF